MATDRSQPAACSELERYLFDLNGYIVIPNALSAQEVAACNVLLDEIQDFVGDGWRGNVRLFNDPDRQEGLIVQQVYEGGPAWESLIDHPSWFAKAVHFIGSDDPEISTAITDRPSSTNALHRCAVRGRRFGCIRAGMSAPSARSIASTPAAFIAARSTC